MVIHERTRPGMLTLTSARERPDMPVDPLWSKEASDELPCVKLPLVVDLD